MKAPAEEMLGTLFAESAGDEFIDLRIIRPGGPPMEKFFPAREISAAVEWAVTHRKAGNVYVGVLPRTRREGTRDAVGSARVLWVDCDSPEAVAGLAAFPLEPSIMVLSGTGGNRHAYWVLSEAIDLERVEALNRALAAATGSDPRVHDAARILRVAGTLNHKQHPPVEVVLAEATSRRYSLAEIEEALETQRRRKPHSTADVADPTPTARLLAQLDGVAGTVHNGRRGAPLTTTSTPRSRSRRETTVGRCSTAMRAAATSRSSTALARTRLGRCGGGAPADAPTPTTGSCSSSRRRTLSCSTIHRSAHTRWSRWQDTPSASTWPRRVSGSGSDAPVSSVTPLRFPESHWVPRWSCSPPRRNSTAPSVLCIDASGETSSAFASISATPGDMSP